MILQLLRNQRYLSRQSQFWMQQRERSAKVITTTTTTIQNEGNGNGKIKLISFCILHPSSFLDTFVSCALPVSIHCCFVTNFKQTVTRQMILWCLSKEGTRVIVYIANILSQQWQTFQMFKIWDAPTPILKPKTI